MKTQIESAVTLNRNLEAINIIAGICTIAENENDLRERMKGFDHTGIIYGYGHNHFWCSEMDVQNPKRILFVDFENQ